MTNASDLVIRGGTVLDGTGGPPVEADVRIAGGRIAGIGRHPAPEDAAEIDATGLFVAPGFIDIHSHSDFTLLVDPRAVSAVSQGVTLEVVGNCGYGCAPIVDPALAREAIYGFRDDLPLGWRSVAGYLERLEAARPAVNVMTLVPNGQLRLGVMGPVARPADSAELERMKRLLREGLEEGAFGYSTGLEYAAEVGASEEEVTALCREVARVGGLYATHTRNRDEAAVEAVAEAVRTAENAGVRLQVSHITPRGGREDTERCIDLVAEARERGTDAAFDMHTRFFGTTYLKVMLPPWAHEGGPAALARRLADPAERARMKTFRSLITALGDFERIVLLDNPALARSLAAEHRGHRPREGIATRTTPRTTSSSPRSSSSTGRWSSCTRTRRSCCAFTYRHDACTVGSDATTLAPDGKLAGLDLPRRLHLGGVVLSADGARDGGPSPRRRRSASLPAFPPSGSGLAIGGCSAKARSRGSGDLRPGDGSGRRAPPSSRARSHAGCATSSSTGS